MPLTARFMHLQTCFGTFLYIFRIIFEKYVEFIKKYGIMEKTLHTQEE